jgi:hypothetical protein
VRSRFLHSQGDLDFQVSALTKYSRLAYHSDLLGDLAFDGIGMPGGAALPPTSKRRAPTG